MNVPCELVNGRSAPIAPIAPLAPVAPESLLTFRKPHFAATQAGVPCAAMGGVLKARNAFVITVRAVAVRPGTIRSGDDGRSPYQVLRLGQRIVRSRPQRVAVFAGISRQDRRASLA